MVRAVMGRAGTGLGGTGWVGMGLVRDWSVEDGLVGNGSVAKKVVADPPSFDWFTSGFCFVLNVYVVGIVNVFLISQNLAKKFLFLSLFLSRYLMKIIFEKTADIQHPKSYSKKFSRGVSSCSEK
jgi:hypothetical protein